MGKIASFIVGLAAGAALGLLLAPEKGEVTRRRIRDEADRLIDEALDFKNRQMVTQELQEIEERVNI